MQHNMKLKTTTCSYLPLFRVGPVPFSFGGRRALFISLGCFSMGTGKRRKYNLIRFIVESKRRTEEKILISGTF